MRTPKKSIRRKLQLISFIATMTVVVLASMTFLFTEIMSKRQDMAEHYLAVAGLIAKNSVGALTFGDIDHAAEVLASLEEQKNVWRDWSPSPKMKNAKCTANCCKPGMPDRPLYLKQRTARWK